MSVPPPPGYTLLKQSQAVLTQNKGRTPIVLGSGKPLFKNLSQPLNLKLVSAKTSDFGAIGLTYQLA
jgi:hypothetical protein